MPHSHEVGEELVDLLDDDRLDDLLARVSLAELADAWRCYQERAAAGEYVDHTDPDWWAVQFWLLPGPVLRREDIVREGLLELVDAVGDELLTSVGVGPLYVFIEANEDRIRWIEEAATHSPRLREALASVDVDHEPDWVRERLERAAGGPLARPDSR